MIEKKTKQIEEMPYWGRIATLLLAMILLPFILLAHLFTIIFQVLIELALAVVGIGFSIGYLIWITISTLMVKPINNKLSIRRTNKKCL